jgi:hypothetical protein
MIWHKYYSKDNEMDYDNIQNILTMIEVAKENNVKGICIEGSRTEVRNYFRNLKRESEQ